VSEIPRLPRYRDRNIEFSLYANRFKVFFSHRKAYWLLPCWLSNSIFMVSTGDEPVLKLGLYEAFISTIPPGQNIAK
jgi:hypothetical protein